MITNKQRDKNTKYHLEYFKQLRDKGWKDYTTIVPLEIREKLKVYKRLLIADYRANLKKEGKV
jgi:hypothetical protein